MSDWVSRVQAGELSESEVRALVQWLLDESVLAESKASLLHVLHERGETPSEIAALADTILERSVPFDVPSGLRPVIDVCGTGGDKLGLFNISTAVMFAAAGAGARVVKHGNRGITSKSGGADVLEALGLPVDLPVERLRNMLAEAGAVFLFAPAFHPAFKAVAPARKILAQRGHASVFNMIGPLLNPARPDGQLAGVFSESLVPLYASVLPRLGRQRAWIVHGRAGASGVMDEISTLGPTIIEKINVSCAERETVTPSDLGVNVAELDALRGGDAAENARRLTEILQGEDRGPARDIVLVNAAAAIVVSGLAETWEEARERAAEALDSRAGWQVLQRMRRVAGTA